MATEAGYLCPQCGLPQGDPRCLHRSGVGGGRPHGVTPLGGTRMPLPSPVPTARPSAEAPRPRADELAPPAPEPAAAAAPRAEGIDVAGRVVPEGKFRLTALGFEGCGKTTYIGMLYFLLTAGKLPGYRFAWSDSLRELETIRAQLHRPLDQGGPSFPPRTSREKTIFLHLGLRRWEDDQYIDVYFPEFSGEDVGQVWSTGRFPPNLSFIADMSGYIVFLDATALGMQDIAKAQLLFSSLLAAKNTKWLEAPVAIVLAKWDTVAGNLTPEDFVKTRLAGLHEMWEGTLGHYRLFGVSSVGAVRNVLGRDGRPVRSAGGEPVTVPAPDAAGGEGGNPVFRYKPKNVSRPLVWLLSELMGEPSGAAP